ncbi:flagellar hook-associated protein FlgL [Methyloversatilis thermotolerans]|uniref:flagellar hook-associated protein FlgL n=1 Tax=Methyloversatilis thermotolerans TaxID=1346290 RepID=UPI00036C42F1|nr:flagellar hook-associated protein FlgL [Methyloversatilis thermotolerans]
MRISTNTVYAAGTSGLLRQSSDLFRLQQQLSTGRRVLAPSDDPVASSRALEIEQSQAINTQYGVNRRDASSALGFAEAQLTTAGDILAAARERIVQAGNAPLSDADRKAVANDLRAMYSEMMGIANSRDAFGDYLFSGYKSTTQPFSGSVEAGASYFGDDGQRMSRIGSNREIPISDPGSDIFMRVPEGNGRFTLTPNAANTGTAVIDAGRVDDVSTWLDPANSGNFEVVFAYDSATKTTTYDIIDNGSGNSLLTGAAPGAAPYPRTWVEGEPIKLVSQGAEPAFDFGVSFEVTGAPATGDRIALQASQSQSVFDTLGDIILALEQTGTDTPADSAKLQNAVVSALTNIDQAQETLLTARSRIGSRGAEIDALNSLGEQVDIHYESTLSDLRDLNYTQAISQLTQQLSYFEAAQQSFMKVSGLSLFNYLS